MPALPSQQTIEIEGEIVRMVTRQVTAEVALADMMPHLVRREPIYLPNAPRGLKDIHVRPENQETRATIILEFPPDVRTVNYYRGRASERSTPTGYRLALPWSYFLFDMRAVAVERVTSWAVYDWRAYWAKTQANSPDTRLTFPHLPNCYTDGRVCFGSVHSENNDRSIGTVIDNVVLGFYLGSGNDDVTLHLPQEYNTLEEWQEASRANPLCWKTWRMWEQDTGMTMDSQLNRRNDFNAPVIIDGMIPQVPLPMTFDQASEWLTSLPDDERKRLIDVAIGQGQWTMRAAR